MDKETFAHNLKIYEIDADMGLPPRECVTTETRTQSCAFWKYNAHSIVLAKFSYYLIYIDLRVHLYCSRVYVHFINKYMLSGNNLSPETNHRVFKSTWRQRNEGAEFILHTSTADTKIFVQTQGWLKSTL